MCDGSKLIICAVRISSNDGNGLGLSRIKLKSTLIHTRSILYTICDRFIICNAKTCQLKDKGVFNIQYLLKNLKFHEKIYIFGGCMETLEIHYF